MTGCRLSGGPLGAVCLCIGLLASSTVLAQTDPDAALAAIASWGALDVATGYEPRASAFLHGGLPDWTPDRWGNLVRRIGSGRPRRVVACGLDRASYAVSQITETGYLRLHRIGRGSSHPLWDQSHEAQQVRILTASGPVPGVVARSNAHFAAQHADETKIVTADDLWVDVGATSAAQVQALGIRLLDPVSRHLPPWTFAGAVAGPAIGARAGCAVLATLAGMKDVSGRGTIDFVLSAQQGLGWVGLGSLLARTGAVDELVVVGPGQSEATAARRPADAMGRLGAVLHGVGLESATVIAPRVRWPGATMETLLREDAQKLLVAVSQALGVEVGSQDWVDAPQRQAFVAPRDARASLAPLADTLTDLVELHSAPGHEWAVRRFVLESLPAWARERAEVDAVGNVTVEVGPPGEATVFVAHMDEVAYEIESIASDGVVALANRGGAVASAWEGQTAILHFDPPGAPSTRSPADAADQARSTVASALQASAPGPVRGVFLSRDDPDQKNPGQLHAWFGLDRSELEAHGVAVGAAVTSYKEGLRLGPTRYTARALDDRAGTAALLLAIRTLDPATVPSRVIFAWSVHEEGGLLGAAALARRLGRRSREVYSVDTFVSSDTPLESPHFAYAPLGAGPVLRAIENSSVAPIATRERVAAVADGAGIPLQLGLTQGGTDGTMFTFWGAPNAGLSWPGRYSHSPGEVLDLRDLARLRDLIAAIAMQRP